MHEAKNLVFVFFYLLCINALVASFTVSHWSDYYDELDTLDYESLRDIDKFEKIRVNDSDLHYVIEWSSATEGEKIAYTYEGDDGHIYNYWGDAIDTPLGSFWNTIRCLMNDGQQPLDIESDGTLNTHDSDDIVSLALQFLGTMFALAYFLMSLLAWNLILPFDTVPVWLSFIHMVVTVPIYIYLVYVLSPYAVKVVKAIGNLVPFT